MERGGWVPSRASNPVTHSANPFFPGRRSKFLANELRSTYAEIVEPPKLDRARWRREPASHEFYEDSIQSTCNVGEADAIHNGSGAACSSLSLLLLPILCLYLLSWGVFRSSFLFLRWYTYCPYVPFWQHWHKPDLKLLHPVPRPQ